MMLGSEKNTNPPTSSNSPWPVSSALGSLQDHQGSHKYSVYYPIGGLTEALPFVKPKYKVQHVSLRLMHKSKQTE